MVMRYYSKLRIKQHKLNLIQTQEKIENLMDQSIMDDVEKKILHDDLMREFKRYETYAKKYIEENLRYMPDNKYLEKRLSFAAWQHMVQLLDNVYIPTKDIGGN